MNPSEPAAPDVLLPGPLYGIRSWRVSPDELQRLRLCGFNGTEWSLDGKSTWARCTWRRHRPPERACTCGLYAVHPWLATKWSQVLWAVQPGEARVVGVVEAWGAVQLHDDGFRAQYARPTALATIESSSGEQCGLAEVLAHAHAAELIDAATLGDLVEHCAAHELGMSQSVVDELLSGSCGR